LFLRLDGDDLIVEEIVSASRLRELVQAGDVGHI
jgi:hypothetical protein